MVLLTVPEIGRSCRVSVEYDPNTLPEMFGNPFSVFSGLAKDRGPASGGMVGSTCAIFQVLRLYTFISKFKLP